jgi:hypothetical protein
MNPVILTPRLRFGRFTSAKAAADGHRTACLSEYRYLLAHYLRVTIATR